MDSFEWNKIAGAILAALMFVLVLDIAIGALFEVPEPAKPGYIVAGVPSGTSATTTSTTTLEAMPDWGAVLPKASVSAGQQVAQRCQQCHDLSRGGPNRIGPNLWGVVNRARATHPGFDYSSAMMANHDPWSYDKLFTYLKLPAAMVPGTKMTFAGLASAQDRINLIAYLRTLADSPAAIPAPAPARAPAPGPAPATSPAPAGATTPASTAAPANQAAAAPAAQTEPDIAHGDVAHGKDVSQRCEQCHDLTKGGPNRIGPNLWDIVNRQRATHPGFDYSSAMAANHEPWTYAKLFQYLKQPQLMVPGTKMTFAGLPSTKDRTDLIAYLRTLSDHPAPLPATK